MSTQPLPELTGTEKQIEWAADIRSALIGQVEAKIGEYAEEPRQVENLRRGLARLTSAPAASDAKFWIDTRRTLDWSHVMRLGYLPQEKRWYGTPWTIPAA